MDKERRKIFPPSEGIFGNSSVGIFGVTGRYSVYGYVFTVTFYLYANVIKCLIINYDPTIKMD